MTRGPLPPAVYWRRRVFVLALAATLVFVIANVLSGGSDGADSGTKVAEQAANETTPSQTITVSGHQGHQGHKGKGRKGRDGNAELGATQGPTFDPSVLAEPDGNCDPADVRITPGIVGAIAGKPVTIGLSLQTVQAEACYFRIGSDKITLKVSKGGRDIWTSRECPGAIPSQSIVVRHVVATVVQMTWDGRESDSTCSHRRSWLMPSDRLTVEASTLGGEPAEADFALASPTPETITVTPHPHRHPKGDSTDATDPSTDSTDGTENPSDTSTDATKPPRR
jgi:hypothetical protein